MRSAWSNPLVVLAALFVGGSVVAAVVVLLVVSLSPPRRDPAALAALAEPAPVPVQPNPEPFGPPVGPPMVPPQEFPKPKMKTMLRAVTPVAITPAPLTQDSTEVKLPGTVTDACVGGGGRYYCLLLGNKKQIAVFDVCAAKVAKYLPVEGEGVKITANMNKLLVIESENFVTRYDLTTLEVEATGKLSFEGKLTEVCMGSASTGPLVLKFVKQTDQTTSTTAAFLDPLSLMELETPKDLGVFRGYRGKAMHTRASPDGKEYSQWCTSQSGTGMAYLLLSDDRSKSTNSSKCVGHVVPGSDGLLHTADGRYTSNLNKKGGDARGPFTLPAVGGRLYFTLSGDGPGDGPDWHPLPPPKRKTATKLKAEVFSTDGDRRLVTLTDLPVCPSDAWIDHDFTADKRYLLVPEAKAFIALAATNDKLIVRKFDLQAALEKSGEDYLFVTSQPGAVKPGKPFEYQIDALSKKGEVRYTLAAGPGGPLGMTVSPGGRVTWSVPEWYTGGEKVAVAVSDLSGRQVFHTFELTDGPVGATVGSQPPAAIARPVTVAVPRSTLEKPTTVSLPSAADETCLGGGGRYLLLRMPAEMQLAVLDLCTGKLLKSIPLPDAKAPFAAGASKVFVYDAATDALQRWDLLTAKKDTTAKNPAGGNPYLLRMGHASEGPLYVGGKGVGQNHFAFLNAATLQPFKLELPTGPMAPFSTEDIRVSADGRVVAWTNSGTFPGTRYTLQFDWATAKVFAGGQPQGELVPASDGTVFDQGTVLAPDQRVVEGTSGGHRLVPATDAPWMLAFEYDVRDPAGKSPSVSIRTVGRATPPLPLDEEVRLASNERYEVLLRAARQVLATDNRFFLNPRAGVLAVVQRVGRSVDLIPLDLKAMLAKAGKGYLTVMSQPPPAVKGRKWTYTPEIWSKAKEVEIKVKTGLTAMTASGGSVMWEVPPDFADDSIQVVLTVSDGTREVDHTFALPVTSKAK